MMMISAVTFELQQQELQQAAVTTAAALAAAFCLKTIEFCKLIVAD